MSRRDTVIIAVLINAGLLIVLFVSALKSDDKGPHANYDPSPAISTVSELPLRPEPVKFAGDEVDAVLSQYSLAASSAPAASDKPTAHQEAEPVKIAKASSEASGVPASFADDLKAIAFSSEAAASASHSAPPIAKDAEAHKNNQFIEVSVKKGDVLEKIAKTHGTSVAQIMQLNGLDSTRLKIGQVLRVPGKSGSKLETVASSAAKNSQTPAKSSSPVKFYTVKNGDNPWTIAVKNHMKVDELLKLNQLDEEKARHLKPGDQLRIR